MRPCRWEERAVQLSQRAVHLTIVQVEQFWAYYNHMIRPNHLPNTSDYHLFKDGVKPMWEVCTAALCTSCEYICGSILWQRAHGQCCAVVPARALGA